MFREFLQRVLAVVIAFIICVVVLIAFSFLPNWASWAALGLYIVAWLGWPFIKWLVGRES